MDDGATTDWWLSELVACRRAAEGSNLTPEEVTDLLLDFSNVVFDRMNDEQLVAIKNDIQAQPALGGIEVDVLLLIDGKLVLRRLGY